MLSAENLVVSYDGTGSRRTLDNVSLKLGNEKAVIVGPNGSGKTSLIKAFLGLAPVSSGSLEVMGKPPGKISGMTNVSTNLPDVYRIMRLAIGDLIRVYADLKGSSQSEAMDLIGTFQLEHVLGKYIHQLSSGEQKMVCNILSMSFRPDLILLDEPFDSVDQGRRLKLASLLNSMQCGVLLNTHEFEVIRRLTGWSMYFMIEGRLFGRFLASQLPNLYINRGIVEGHISRIETSFGDYSITENGGQVPIAGARNLASLLDEVS